MLLRRLLRHPLRMGGHGHGHAGEARLFGEPPVPAGQSRKWQEWEAWNYVMWGGTVLLTAGYVYRRNTSPLDWAKDEAEERRRRISGDLPVHYGVNYAAIRYMKETNAVSEEVAERLEGGEVVPPTMPELRSPKSL